MCCGHVEYQREIHGCGCGCHIAGHEAHRRFFSREERVERLKAYLQNLKAEMQGVEEQIRLLSQEEGR